MKQQLSPAVFVAIIAVVVLVAGAFFVRQAVYTPPTPRVQLYPHQGGATQRK